LWKGNRWKEKQAHTQEHNDPIKNKKPVDILISPIPTKGDTIPPKANPIAPKRAEATPAFLRSQSIAKVLEAVKVIPTIASRQKISIS